MKTETETKASERTVRIPRDVHRRLRIAAAQRASTMASITEHALLAELHRLEGAPPSASPDPIENTDHANA